MCRHRLRLLCARRLRLVAIASALTLAPFLSASTHAEPATEPPSGVSTFSSQSNATPSPSATWENYIGDWRAQADAARVVERGVHGATAGMNFIARPIARRRLLHRFPAPTGLRLQRDSNVFVIEFLGPGAVIQRLPVSGAEVLQHGAHLRLRLESAGLRHTGTTGEGQRENFFRLGNTPGVLTMETTITSPQLPEPVRYTITFERLRSAPAPAAP